MFFKYAIFFCVFLFIVDTEARAKQEATFPAQPLNLDGLKKNMDEFKSCVDKSLANVVGEVNEKQLQPLFDVIGDQLNRFSKAFEELTAPKPKSSIDEN